MMSVPRTVLRAAQWGLGIAEKMAFLAPLLTRITLGYAFFLTGRGKLEHFEDTVGFFATQRVPFPELNAAFVSRLEFYGGILLALGLLTRIVSAGLASTMVVALITEWEQFLRTWSPSPTVEALGPTDISSFVFLLFLGWLVLYGPGWMSLDGLLSKWLGIKVKSSG